MPQYDIIKKYSKENPGNYSYLCTLKYRVPDNDKGIMTSQRIDFSWATRSKARELAAEFAYRFVINNGLWMNLADCGIEPNLMDSINQLQELYQKKYLEEKPDYIFNDSNLPEWNCTCICGGIEGRGHARSKTQAKKNAAFVVLVNLMKSAGICKKEWDTEMWKLI